MKKMKQTGKESEAQDTVIRMLESTQRSLEAEIDKLHIDAHQQRKAITALEKERDKYDVLSLSSVSLSLDFLSLVSLLFLHLCVFFLQYQVLAMLGPQ